MPLTAIDPNTALLVIDLQKGTVSGKNDRLPVVAKAVRLAEAFRRRGLPVVLVNVAGGAPGRKQNKDRSGSRAPDWTELIPELGRQPQDHVVTKRTWGAFTKTDLEAHLRSLGVTQVVICGIATSIGVESTARQAYDLGFNVTLAIDAMADGSPEAHSNSLERIFPRLGETGAADDIIDRLGASLTTPAAAP